MSKRGPAASPKNWAGRGCQANGGGFVTVAAAANGAPISPASIRRRAVCSALPRNVSGAAPTRSPRRRAMASSRARVGSVWSPMLSRAVAKLDNSLGPGARPSRSA